MSVWQELPLGELGTEVRENVTPEAGVTYAHYSVPSFANRAPDIEDGGAIKSNKRQLRPGDVLVCRINPRINRVWVVGEHDLPIIGSTEWVTLRLPEDSLVDRSFLLWYLRSPRFRADITSSVSGVTGSHTRAKRKKVLGYSVPVPSLDKQRAIAEIVERMLSQLDAATRTLASADRKARNAERAMLNAMSQADQDAELVRLREVLSEPLRNGHSAKESPDGNGIRTLTLTAVTDGVFDDTTSKVTVADRDRVSDLWLEPDDILIERANTPELVGTTRRYDGPTDWAIFPDLIIRARVNSDVCDPRFAEMALRSPSVQSYFRDAARGGAGSMPKINQSIVNDAEFWLPNIDTQREIVDRFQSFVTRLHHQQAAVAGVLERAPTLRRSILEAAFEDRLTNDTDTATSVEDLEEAIA